MTGQRYTTCWSENVTVQAALGSTTVHTVEESDKTIGIHYWCTLKKKLITPSFQRGNYIYWTFTAYYLVLTPRANSLKSIQNCRQTHIDSCNISCWKHVSKHSSLEKSPAWQTDCTWGCTQSHNWHLRKHGLTRGHWTVYFRLKYTYTVYYTLYYTLQ